MLSSSSQFDVGQTKKRIRSDVARRRSRLLKGHGGDRPSAASGEAERPFTEVLQFCLAAKRSQTEKLRSVIETAREETVVNRWIPKVLRQFFRRQGGFNKSVIKALDTVLTGLGTLGSEQSEARAYLNAQYYWLRDFADRQEQMGKSLEELVHRVAKKEEDFYTLEVENGRLVESVAHLRRFAGVLLTNLDREAETARQMKAAMSDLLNGLDQEIACRKEQETRLESITAQVEGLARAT